MIGILSNPEHVRAIRWKHWPKILETQQFEAEVLESLMVYFCKLEQDVACNGKRLSRLSKPITPGREVTFATDEASTRTQKTFQKASRILGFEFEAVQGGFSSSVKGESIEYQAMAHTQVVGMGPLQLTNYYIIRSKEEQAAHRAAEAIDAAMQDGFPRLPIPVINAGDGEHQHPTQAITDLTTIYRERSCHDGRPSLQDLTVLIIGDVKHGRTVNSLCHLLGRFSDTYRIKIIFCTHPELGPKEGMQEYLKERKVPFEVRTDYEQCLREASVVYVTRIQRERFAEDEETLYREAKRKYIFHKKHLALLQKDALVLHPLPINEDPKDPPPEIDPELRALAFSGHSQCAWARQSLRHLFVRYGLLDQIEAGLQELPEYQLSIQPR